MSALTFQFLQLLIYPFTNKSLFVWIGGLLCCTWLFSVVYGIIRGDYST